MPAWITSELRELVWVPMACTIALFGALAFAAERLLFRRFALG
jgi:hypothetical protein